LGIPEKRIIYRLDVVVLPLALYIHHNQMPHVSNPPPKMTDILEESKFGQRNSNLDPPHPPTHPWNMLDSALVPEIRVYSNKISI